MGRFWCQLTDLLLFAHSRSGRERNKSRNHSLNVNLFRSLHCQKTMPTSLARPTQILTTQLRDSEIKGMDFDTTGFNSIHFNADHSIQYTSFNVCAQSKYDYKPNYYNCHCGRCYAFDAFVSLSCSDSKFLNFVYELKIIIRRYSTHFLLFMCMKLRV